jgi:hypothetical protein
MINKVRKYCLSYVDSYGALRDLFYLADLSGNAAWFETFLREERGEEGSPSSPRSSLKKVSNHAALTDKLAK